VPPERAAAAVDLPRVGVWLVGAHGALATTAVVGARAIVRGLAGTQGLVTALPEIARLPLAPLDRLVFGGWEVDGSTLLERARALAREHGSLPAEVVEALADDLRAADANVRAGFDGCGEGAAGRTGCREPLGEAAERLRGDLRRFRADHGLDTVVVVNVASTESPVEPRPEHEHLAGFERLLREDRGEAVTPSMLYAYAALGSDCPYVNFTPSPGAALGALRALAAERRLPYYGNDGKTGETLVRSVLAPLFAWRNLEVLAWHGVNLLGGGDGRVLADPGPRGVKVRSKHAALERLLGYRPEGGVAIEYVPSLGNWKTAWDYIQFRGFLGTRMTLQFVWQGCDSVLAAPLVLDLARLAEFARRAGEWGPMRHLACFFKDPLGVEAHALAEQHRLLADYVARHTGRRLHPAAGGPPRERA
jgi:myo-inositol-1-phosphate synthase